MTTELKPEPKRVMLVEDDIGMIRAVRTALDEDERLRFVGYLTGRANLEEFLDQHAPDVALVDVLLLQPRDSIGAHFDVENGYQEGLSIIATISEHSPHTKIIGFSNYFIVIPSLAKQALDHGADALIAKHSSPQEWWAWTSWLCGQLHAVMDGWWRITPEVAQLLQEEEHERLQMEPDAPLPLTQRQMEVLERLSAKKSDSEIAQELCIEDGAVRGHIANIKKRLQFRYRWQVIEEARRHGLGETT
ncbi:MAG: response regulator transcription factor [Caldilineaceae bacterium]